jgi:hypothetical protein
MDPNQKFVLGERMRFLQNLGYRFWWAGRRLLCRKRPKASAVPRRTRRPRQQLKAHKQLPVLLVALQARQNKNSQGVLARQANTA